MEMERLSALGVLGCLAFAGRARARARTHGSVRDSRRHDDGWRPGCASESFCKALPKVELHAHLHGSIRDATLLELAEASGSTTHVSQCKAAAYGDRSLSDCFKLFDLIHHLVTDVATVRRITREVVEDFHAENVQYLELRTTPRAMPDLRAYCAAVIDTLEQCAQELPGITCRILLSVNRSSSLQFAEQVLALALELASEGPWVVGLDFSGNPSALSFEQFRPVFESARHAGLRTAVHVGELGKEARYTRDTDAVLDFAPDRLGHAVHLNSAQRSRLLGRPIPIEICPTSNLMTLQLGAVEEHPTLGLWLRSAYPLVLCTDDAGVFSTTLSRELHLVARAYGLGDNELLSLAVRSIDFIFDESAKATLRERFVSAFQVSAQGQLIM